ncbi:MAG: DNA-3-methyladenine glycosylase 2 family protein [Candidatus Bathyarchaeota archaeon]|nr:DNA-3-methyladenine glycosylase 2 family protein [Candidatus Bathyarchaeota archaeon]
MEIKLNNSTVPFSLEHTLDCGQLFRWTKHGDWWYGVVADTVIKIKQNTESLSVEFFPEPKNQEFIENYLRLDDNLPEIFSQINTDQHINQAINKFCGLRLIRQQPWECLISYICATYKSIPAIKTMISNISNCFGNKLRFDDKDFYTFPNPDKLAKAGSEALRRCGLGFRAERVLETAKLVDSGELSLEHLKQLPYQDAKKELLALPGVGHKVADCVLLFSLDKLEAFPIDVWMKRAATNLYANHFDSVFIHRISAKGSLTPKEYSAIGSFAREYFGNYAGYAQEYLFHYLRTQQR